MVTRMTNTNSKTVKINFFGFPIVIIDCPHIEIDGKLKPNVNYTKLENMLFEAMPYKPSKLTGAEIKFIRTHLNMTQKTFAAWMNDTKTHSAISIWESSDLEPTNMEDADERSLRLQLIDFINHKKRKNSINLHETLQRLTISIKRRKHEKELAVNSTDYTPVPGYGLYPQHVETRV